jgi:hypothetical protein
MLRLEAAGDGKVVKADVGEVKRGLVTVRFGKAGNCDGVVRLCLWW